VKTSFQETILNYSLVLVPSPLDEEEAFGKALPELISAYEEKNIPYEILVESEKIARKRWIKSGLKRDKISQFILYNEHNQEKENSSILLKMEQGIRFILISDEGLPTFFDPGQKLVFKMHQKNLKVHCLSFPCSPLLALILSGFDSARFLMAGFPPVKTEEREKFFADLHKIKETIIVMDTAYRLKATLEQMAVGSNPEQLYFLGLDLARSTEEYFMGTLKQILKKVDFNQKKDFILIKASVHEK
jgi:16S rRNA (cytidine(1402)-2'-O)-methyltransferase